MNRLMKVDQPISPELLLEEMNSRIVDFRQQLDSLKHVDVRTRKIWREIYENALQDRQNAYRLYADIWNSMQGDPLTHVTHGTTAAKYLERMSKANDQMIQLSGLMAEASKAEDSMSPEQILDQISEEIEREKSIKSNKETKNEE